MLLVHAFIQIIVLFSSHLYLFFDLMFKSLTGQSEPCTLEIFYLTLLGTAIFNFILSKLEAT